MSLDNIQLSTTTIRGLFKNSLVCLKSSNTSAEIQNVSLLKVLGKNAKNITIIVNNAENDFLSDANFKFLTKMLAACKINMEDVALLNITNTYPHYIEITKQLNSEKILLFGVEPKDIQLPLSFPNYQIQRYNNQTYLASCSLSHLEHNKEEKQLLWNCLTKIFFQ